MNTCSIEVLGNKAFVVNFWKDGKPVRYGFTSFEELVKFLEEHLK